MMASQSVPRNRSERRAQARTNRSSTTEVSLSQPSREPSTNKTLLDIAFERQLLNGSPTSTSPSIMATRISPDGTLLESESLPELQDPEPTPYLDIALYITTLTILHFTLTVLVHYQYAAEPPSLPSILYSSTIASPTPALLLVIVSMLHPRSSFIITQALFAVLSVAAGAWLVHASNKDPYMAVMKKAPPLGTLWVWAFIEMRWEWAAGSLGVVGAWGWYNGYRMY